MHIDESSMVPIYIQIADAIEEDIVLGYLKEGGPCYSQLILAKELKVNPATAAKGINLLVSRGILEKNRGQAMTVVKDAVRMIRERKQRDELEGRLRELAELAATLAIPREQLLARLNQVLDEKEGGNA
jgi:GntR family transcriptional regulator